MKLFESYTNGTESEKEALERRYGKKQLLSMINDIQAEAWIGQNSKQCPHCNAPIEVYRTILELLFESEHLYFQKKDGCNKMSCPRCNTYFCWLCMAQLDTQYPYLHFSKVGAKCNLFEGIVHEDGDDADQDWVHMNAGFDDDDDFTDDDDDEDLALDGVIIL